MVEKAVILAAGSASRMQTNIERYVRNHEELSAIKKGEKMAVRFGEMPFLDYQILNLIEAGLKEINIVLRPDDTFFRDHYSEEGKILFPEVDISFSFQEVADGTAHAVLASAQFVEDERFLVLNGDNHYPLESLEMLLGSPEDNAAMVAFDTEGFNEWTRRRIKVFAMIQTEDGKLKRIFEKPENPMDYRVDDRLYKAGEERVVVADRNLASMNLWCFNSDIIERCRDVPRHESRCEGKPGEFELPDAVDLLMQRGRDILVFYACTDVLDLTRAEDIAIVDHQIRENLNDRIEDLEKRYARLC